MGKRIMNCCGGIHRISSIKTEKNQMNIGRGIFHRIIGLTADGHRFILDHSTDEREIDREFKELQQFMMSDSMEVFDCRMVKNQRVYL